MSKNVIKYMDEIFILCLYMQLSCFPILQLIYSFTAKEFNVFIASHYQFCFLFELCKYTLTCVILDDKLVELFAAIIALIRSKEIEILQSDICVFNMVLNPVSRTQILCAESLCLA